MRILQILPELNVGGVETGTIDLAKYLLEHGHYPVVVSRGGELVKWLDTAGIKHYALPVHEKSIFTIIKCVAALKKIIDEENIDIVHARSRVPAWIAYFATRQTNAEFLTTCHGHYSQNFFSRVMGWAKLLIVPSNVIGRHMVEHFGVVPDRIRAIPRSVDLNRFVFTEYQKKESQRFIISMVGRMTPLKGHEYFLRAVAKVVRSMPLVKVWIVGDAPANKVHYRQELELLVERLGLKQHVEFFGNRQDIPRLLAKSHLLVFPSTVPESFGRVIIEAQAVGVPVVATQVGGVIDIIKHEETGLLVDPKDVEQMTQAILRVINEPTLVKNMIQAGRKRVEECYTLDQMAGQTIKVYEELMASKRILVIKLSALGDVILATAAFKALRKEFPQAKIYCLVGKECRRVLYRCPYLDGVIIADPKNQERSFWGILRFSKKLREYQFEKVIDLQNNWRSHLFAFLSFPKMSFGYKNKKGGFLLSHPVANPEQDLNPVDQQFQILSSAGLSNDHEKILELWPSPADQRKVRELLDGQWLREEMQLVGINIAASEKWVTKNWPVEHIARVCDLLAAKNIRVLITGTGKDKLLVEELLKRTKSKPVILVGKTNVMELAVLIKKCRVFITPDSAPMHIAAAMKTPFIAFFGPTNSIRHLPPAESYVVLEQKPLCSPCYSPQCKILTHACMKEIKPEEVVKRVYQLMEK